MTRRRRRSLRDLEKRVERLEEAAEAARNPGIVLIDDGDMIANGEVIDPEEIDGYNLAVWLQPPVEHEIDPETYEIVDTRRTEYHPDVDADTDTDTAGDGGEDE